ncbi:MAG: MBL fold metallo-hydrolase [Acidobacteria bacterium]|nr:MBL fold metallo-hydrolase [Acidobacteriota bacterium]MBI3427451.1 MBL fold metallo-hydrolase [Acidobacteriota bacterium]
MRVVIRVNGRGNAWPLELGANGTRHRLHRCSAFEYANTSLSIVGYASKDDVEPEWEVLFDVGQGVVPFLIQTSNRLPDAVLISHPHYDHVAGLDWLGASNRRNRQDKAKLPIFATTPCWAEIAGRFPWLNADFALNELGLRQKISIAAAPGLSVTAFPVFHGAFAPGACLMLLEYEEGDSHAKAILSGDLLTPLIAPHDYDLLSGAAIAYVDTNTRFPWPKTGHWSLTDKASKGALDTNPLKTWFGTQDVDRLLAPHKEAQGFEAFCESFKSSINSLHELCWSIDTFVKWTAPQSVALVHYSGYEDAKEHNEPILTDTELLDWVSSEACSKTVWRVPRVADEFVLHNDD